jgi:hypothetical protein
LCKKKGPKRDHFSRTKKEKGPFQQEKKEKKDFCVKKGPKKDHFSSLVLKRTKSLIKDLYVSTGSEKPSVSSTDKYDCHATKINIYPNCSHLIRE